MSDIITRFVRNRGFRLICDGDLDSLFASGMLIKALIELEEKHILDGSIRFPRARELKKISASDSILIELGPERGITFKGSNLLIDHHPDPPRVVLYEGTTPTLTRKYSISTSVAGLILHIFGDKINAPEDLIFAIDEADYRNYATQLAYDVARAFIISRNVPNEEIFDEVFSGLTEKVKYEGKLIDILLELVRTSPIYGYIPLAIMTDSWDSIDSWVRTEAERYKKVALPKAKRLYNRATRRETMAFIIYDYGDPIERTALLDAIYTLAVEFEVAFAIGVTRSGFTVRIETYNPEINLKKLCQKIRMKNVECGGRSDILFLYFPADTYTLGGIIQLITKNLIETYGL